MTFRRSKHIDTRYFWIRERHLDGDLNLEYIAGDDQIADIHTKPVPKPRLLKLRALMGLA